MLIEPFQTWLEACRDLNCGEILFSEGQYSPDEKLARRIQIFEVKSKKIKKLKDGWCKTDEVEYLANSINQIKLTRAKSDAMYATQEMYVWSLEESVLRLWEKSRLKACIDENGVELFGLGKSRYFEAKQIKKIHGFLSSTWVKRGLRVHVGLKKYTLAQATEHLAWADPTYGGLDLLGDSFWIHDLANAIQKVSELPIQFDKDLK